MYKKKARKISLCSDDSNNDLYIYPAS